MIPHKILLTGTLAVLALTLHAQTWIGLARNQSNGTIVTVKGIALNGPELGEIRFIQDETGAIALYPGNGSVSGLEAVQAGDEVLATGEVDSYQGLKELSPILSVQVLTTGNPLPEPQTLFPGDFSDFKESEHIRLQCASFQDDGLFESNRLYTLDHYSGTGFNLYIAEGHPLVGLPIPEVPVELTGILSQYNNYQVLVRGLEDLPTSACLYFTTDIYPIQIETESLHLYWKTNDPCTCKVRYGLTPAMDNEAIQPNLLPIHTLVLEDLEPATAYYLQSVCELNGAEVRSPVRIFSTASTSSGSMQVYFNQSTDPAFSTGSFPEGSTYQQTEAAILERIEQAQTSIDVAVYNANLTAWIQALKDAHGRGVKIRYIFEDESTNSALSGALPFPILEGNPGALMHHKFMVVDADDPDKAYVMLSSMNWTSSGLKNDFNNTLIIQDQALARAYRTEFNEMWGAPGQQPDFYNARFGAAKVENTPSLFRIGERLVENYFTPSEHIISILEDRLHSADESLDAALFILTKDELAGAIKDGWSGGLPVRAIIEDVDISGSDFYFLQSHGVPVQEHEASGLFHHKYALVDAGDPDSDPMVITGSYNWTAAATFDNDEYILIVHDAEIANLYRQEFEARWQEVTPVSEIRVSAGDLAVFPNPASGVFFVEWRGEPLRNPVLRLWTSDGRLAGEKRPDALGGGEMISWQLPAAQAGLFVLSCTLPDGRVQTKTIVLD
jgi:phosphatidylserine/phosphatidylglycerophosphate/cardiolipin synthase-like enzyme